MLKRGATAIASHLPLLLWFGFWDIYFWVLLITPHVVSAVLIGDLSHHFHTEKKKKNKAVQKTMKLIWDVIPFTIGEETTQHNFASPKSTISFDSFSFFLLFIQNDGNSIWFNIKLNWVVLKLFRKNRP